MNILEDDVPFSHSLLWELQREYFQAAGVTAWSTHTVPLYVTNNPALARAYAAVVAAWLEDAARRRPHLLSSNWGRVQGDLRFCCCGSWSCCSASSRPSPFVMWPPISPTKMSSFAGNMFNYSPFANAAGSTSRSSIWNGSSLTLLDSGAVIGAACFMHLC